MHLPVSLDDTPTIHAAFTRLVAQLEDALRAPGVAARVARAGTTVTLRAQGADALCCTLRLTGPEASVVDGAEPADVAVVLSEAAIDGFWDRSLAMWVVRGEASYDGPVRSLMAVLPILRAQVGRPG